MTLSRTAVLGASSLAGKELLERLGSDRKRLGRLALGEGGSDEIVGSTVGGEWVVSTPILDEALEEADLVVCCQRLAEPAREAVRAAASKAVVLDLTGTLGGRAFDARRAQGAGERVTLASLGPGVHASPGASSLIVAALARAASRAGAAGPCVAVSLEPASELGREAVDELFAQAVAVLNFQPMPTQVFGRQAVHDVVSPGLLGLEVEARLRREVAELGGGETAVLVARPGVFHGIAVAARAAVDAAAWRREIAAEPRLSLADAGADAGDAPEASPVSAVAGGEAVVGRVVADGAGGSWAWAAADTLAHGAVGNVVDLILAS